MVVACLHGRWWVSLPLTVVPYWIMPDNECYSICIPKIVLIVILIKICNLTI